MGRNQPQIRRDLSKFVSMSLLASLWFQGAGSIQILIKKLRVLFLALATAIWVQFEMP